MAPAYRTVSIVSALLAALGAAAPPLGEASEDHRASSAEAAEDCLSIEHELNLLQTTLLLEKVTQLTPEASVGLTAGGVPDVVLSKAAADAIALGAAETLSAADAHLFDLSVFQESVVVESGKHRGQPPMLPGVSTVASQRPSLADAHFEAGTSSPVRLSAADAHLAFLGNSFLVEQGKVQPVLHVLMPFVFMFGIAAILLAGIRLGMGTQANMEKSRAAVITPILVLFLQQLTCTLVIPTTYALALGIGRDAGFSGTVIGMYMLGACGGSVSMWALFQIVEDIWRKGWTLLVIAGSCNIIGAAVYCLLSYQIEDNVWQFIQSMSQEDVAYYRDGGGLGEVAPLGWKACLLIMSRFTDGFGTGVLVNFSMVALTHLVPPEERPAWAANNMLAVMLGLGFGPMVASMAPVFDLYSENTLHFGAIGVAYFGVACLPLTIILQWYPKGLPRGEVADHNPKGAVPSGTAQQPASPMISPPASGGGGGEREGEERGGGERGERAGLPSGEAQVPDAGRAAQGAGGEREGGERGGDERGETPGEPQRGAVANPENSEEPPETKADTAPKADHIVKVQQDIVKVLQEAQAVKPKVKGMNDIALLCTGLVMTAIRGFVISGLEAATTQLLQTRYGWTKEAVGPAIGFCFLCALPVKVLQGVLHSRLSLHGWIRISGWIGILAPMLMFPAVTQFGLQIGLWSSFMILVANALLFPALMLGDAWLAGIMLQHIFPPGNWFDANYFLLYRAMCSLSGRGIGPPFARMAVDAGQGHLAMQLFLCGGAFMLVYEALFRRFDYQACI